MKDSYSWLVAAFIYLLSTSNVIAQDSLRQSIDTIIIKSTRISQNLDRSTYSVSSLHIDHKPLQQALSVNEYLHEVPGLFALNSNNYAQDLRVSIRGFGARSAFGIRGIKIIVDGVPETTPDGQGQIDNLELNLLKSIEVIRGPSSSLYGNASGGILDIRTLDAYTENFTKVGFTLGSYGMYSIHGQTGIVKGSTNISFSMNHTATDGYREFSGMKSTSVGSSLSKDFNDGSVLRINLNYTNSPQADDPGGINLMTLEENRRQARDRNLLFQAGEEISQFKASAVFQKEFNNENYLNSYAFLSTRDFNGRLPFEFGGIVDLSRLYWGHGSHLNIMHSFGKSVNRVQAGYEFAFQNDERDRYVNMQGDQGNQTLGQLESFSNFGVFVLDHFSINKLTLTGGLRYDINELSVEDRFLTNGDDSGDRTLNSFNPSIGINYELFRSHHFFAHYSTSFETPTLSELSSNPTNQGGFNDNLKPQNAKSIEFGIKGRLENNLSYEIVYFSIETENEIVPFELEAFPGRDFFRNAGNTQRKGFEGIVNYQLSNYWKARIMYTFSDFKYGEYLVSTENLEGNYLPGIPRHFGSFAIDYIHPSNWRIGLLLRQNGSLFVSDENSVKDASYRLLNFSISRFLSIGEMTWAPFFGVNNLLDVKYNDNIRINAFGGRYYEPGPGINFYGGVKATF